MKEYRVEFIENETIFNGGGWDNEWYSEIVEAESALEAIELCKQYLIENGEEPEKFRYCVYEPAESTAPLIIC